MRLEVRLTWGLLLGALASSAGACVKDTPFGRSCDVDSDCDDRGIYQCKVGYCVRGNMELDPSLLGGDGDGDADAGTADVDGGLVGDGDGDGDGDGGTECAPTSGAISRRRLSGYVDEAGHFGSGVVLDGDVLYVGSPDAQNPGNLPQGNVRVFRFEAGAWSEAQELTLTPPQESSFGWWEKAERFGEKLSTAQSFLAVTAANAEPHNGKEPEGWIGSSREGMAAAIYRLDGGWHAEAVLVCGDDDLTNLNFYLRGDVDTAIDQGGNLIAAVGAVGAVGTHAGVVCTFARAGLGPDGAWASAVKLDLPEDIEKAGGFIRFGPSAETLFVRAQRGGENVMLVYRRSGMPGQLSYAFEGELSLPARAEGTGGQSFTDLAISLAPSPTRPPYALIGTADWRDPSRDTEGAAYFRTLSDGSLPPPETLLAPPLGVDDPGFGATVAARGALAVVGSSDVSATEVFLYEEVCGAWTLAAELNNEEGNVDAAFGAQLRVNDRHVVVTAPDSAFLADDLEVGHVYVFTRSQ